MTSQTESEANTCEPRPALAKAVDVLLQEYSTLRAEALKCIDKQYQILVLQITGLGALLALKFQDKSNFSDPLFWSLLPILVFALTLLWLSEQRRMMRAGDHLVSIEATVNHLLRSADAKLPDVLTWEQSLRPTPGQSLSARLQIQELLSIAGVLLQSAAIGIYSAWWMFRHGTSVYAALGIQGKWMALAYIMIGAIIIVLIATVPLHRPVTAARATPLAGPRSPDLRRRRIRPDSPNRPEQPSKQLKT